MHNQSSGRNQRPRGFKFRWALQFSLLLAVCVWFLYQTKHSHDKKKHDGSSKQGELISIHNSVNMGRKGNAGWTLIGVESGYEDLDIVEGGEKKQDGGAGDDELDRNVEERAEEESDNKADDSRLGNDEYHRDKEDGREQEGQYKEFQTIEVTNSYYLVEDRRVNTNKNRLKEEYSKDRYESAKGIMTEQDDQGDEKVPETEAKATGNDLKNHTGSLTKGKNEAIERNDEEEGLHGIANATDPRQNEKDNIIHTFYDENGVPQDIMEALPMEPSGNQNINLQREITLSLDNQSETMENMPREGKKTELGNITNIVNSETESRDALEDSKIEKRSVSIGHSYSSVVSISNYASDTEEERNLVIEDASSVPSQQKQEEGISTGMFLQAE